MKRGLHFPLGSNSGDQPVFEPRLKFLKVEIPRFLCPFFNHFYDRCIDYDHGGEECYAICTRVIHIRSRIGLTLESSDAIESIATHASKPERNAALLGSLQFIHRRNIYDNSSLLVLPSSLLR